MNKFLSNDRKVILKSAATGVGIILAVSFVLFTESMLLWGTSFFVVLATYWFIPTCFNSSRQLEKRIIPDSFLSKNAELYGPFIPEYEYLNAEGKQISNLSNKEQKRSVILLFIISAFLIFVVYDPIIKLLLALLPTLEPIMLSLAATLYLSTPYLIRHIYCFTLNQPIDTSLQFFKNNFSSDRTNASHINKFDNSSFRNTASSPSYSFLSYNIYNRN